MPKIIGIDTKEIRTDINVLEEQASSPANPSAGDKKFYAKNDGKIYTLDSSGSEVEVGSGATDYNVEKFTLSAGDITAKQITLASIPTSLTLSRLIIIGGLEQDYSVDFSVSGTTLTWNALGLDGVLAAADKLVVIYN